MGRPLLAEAPVVQVGSLLLVVQVGKHPFGGMAPVGGKDKLPAGGKVPVGDKLLAAGGKAAAVDSLNLYKEQSVM